MEQQGARPGFYLNTYLSNCAELARRFGAGLEIIEFSIATRIDDLATSDAAVRERVDGITSLMLHAPYHDLAPGTIDPEVRGVTMMRYQQAYQIAASYGIDRIVCHAGYTPRLYRPQDWVIQAAAFWREFLAGKPATLRIFLENVAEEHPDLLRDLVDAVDDPRLAICLDVGHANAYSPVPLPEWIDSLADRVRHVHLHNNDGSADQHWRLDKGTIDMAETMHQLAQRSPHASYTVEAAEEEACFEWLSARGWLG